MPKTRRLCGTAAAARVSSDGGRHSGAPGRRYRGFSRLVKRWTAPRGLSSFISGSCEGISADLERQVALLVEQAQERLLEEENLSTGWEG